jgi:transcriptional regulator with GAF, ATPase, and Fis domain
MTVSAEGREEDEADVDALHRDLAEAREHLAATSEVLTALGRSASDLDAVLGAVVENARRLCRADAAQIQLVAGDAYRLACSTGLSDEYIAHTLRNPVRFDRRTMIGRVGIDRRTQQIPDVLADPEYGRFDNQRVGGFRTTMAAPMLLDDEVVGVLCIWRTEVDPFDDRSAALLTTFAAQAAIAIRNVDLVRALEERGVELASKIEQLEALGEVGEAVSSSLDLDQVLATIVTRSRCPTCVPHRSIRTCNAFMTPAGDRSSRCRCCVRTASWERSWCAA